MNNLLIGITSHTMRNSCPVLAGFHSSFLSFLQINKINIHVNRFLTYYLLEMYYKHVQFYYRSFRQICVDKFDRRLMCSLIGLKII